MNIPEREEKDYFSSSKFVTELNPKDFDPISTWKLRNHKCSIVLFYAPWCPYCKKMKELWERLGEKAVFFDVCAFNCQKYSAHTEKIKHNDMPDLISGYPTMIIYNNGDPVEKVATKKSERNIEYLISSCMRACKKS